MSHIYKHYNILTFDSYLQAFCIFYLLIFNWRILALQYYAGFYQISAWINRRFNCPLALERPSHCPPHPAPLGCHWGLVWIPMAVYLTYGNVHFHVTPSIHPTSPSSPIAVSICLFSTSVSPLLLCKYVHQVYVHIFNRNDIVNNGCIFPFPPRNVSQSGIHVVICRLSLCLLTPV